MATLDQFTTTAVVAAGMRSHEIESTLDAFDAYVLAQPHEERHRALTEARERLDGVGIVGSVREVLDREIEIRLSRPASA